MLTALLLGAAPFPALSQSDEGIQGQIDDRGEKIRLLQEEIAALPKQVDTVVEEKQTLESAISALDLSIKKVNATISLTQTRISRADLQIRRLAGGISTTTQKIGDERSAVGETLRRVASRDETSVVVDILSGNTLSVFFDDLAALGAIRDQLRERIEDLTSLKKNLETTKSATERTRAELATLKATLSQEQQALAAVRGERATLLKETQNKESSYQRIIADKRVQEAQFEQELRSLEEQLGLTVGAGDIPSPHAGILSWPFASDYMQRCPTYQSVLKNSICITQYFGNTPFATQNPQIYNNKGHNAVDFRASPGTPILAAQGGTVTATGNTDLQRGCYSYGKWILLEHNNGLSTLYAHLSVIGVGKGQNVGRGAVIGYSGSTGYATGPHLHFGVFATHGIQITLFSTSKNCKGVTVSLVDPSAYLNPLSYLPTGVR